MNYKVFNGKNVPIKAWVDGVALDEGTLNQAKNIAGLDIIHKHVALMPDCHVGKGATIGSVIPTRKAIIPAAVGVDLGCGMLAVQTDLVAGDLPDSLAALRTRLECAVLPNHNNKRDAGGRHAEDQIPEIVQDSWSRMHSFYKDITEKHSKIETRSMRGTFDQLGTLGGGNHFLEICLAEDQTVWLMLHSGSRGVGNRIGTYFIEKAREEMRECGIDLPDRDLAYLAEKSRYFKDYWDAVKWAQEFAFTNRKIMLVHAHRSLSHFMKREVRLISKAVQCHHNYVAIENHFDEDVYVTRKGAIKAGKDDLGIIPGSMGACSFIVRGKGNAESFHSCSHGAGRAMSRTQAKKRFSLEDHERATQGVECRKDITVIDETPGAYKDIEKVMLAQSDLVEVLHRLKQVLCVKG